MKETKRIFLLLFFLAHGFIGFAQDKSIWESLNYENNKVLVAAHRGDWKNYPENSLPGIQSCMDRGIDIVEIDVQKTSDGHFILMHDPSVRRTTNGKRKVSKYTLSQIKKLKLRDKNGKLTSYTVPTLEEALELTKGKVILNLDKSAGRFNELLPILEKHNCGQNIIMKGEGPATYFKTISSSDRTGTLFMPILNGRKSNLDTFVMESQVSLIEVLLKSDSDEFCKRPLLDKIKNLNCKIWYNALFNSISGGHTESQNAISSWDWFIEHDAKVIQTDYPFELLQYLIDKGLHEAPEGFTSVDLSKLPNKKRNEDLKDSLLLVDSLQNANETIFKETSLVIENENEKSGTAKIEPKKTTTKKENKNQKKYHVVNKGESLNRIAHNYGISTKRLLKLNPKIKANHKLKIGTKLRVR